MIWIVLLIAVYILIGSLFAYQTGEVGDVILWPFVLYVGVKERWSELKEESERYK